MFSRGLLRWGEIPGLDVLAAHESCVHAVVEAVAVGIPALRPAHRLDLHRRVDGQGSSVSPAHRHASRDGATFSDRVFGGFLESTNDAPKLSLPVAASPI